MKLILNDGCEYGIVWCGESEGILRAEINICSEVLPFAEKFSDAGATCKIRRVSEETEAETVFEGYTDLLDVKKDRYTEHISVALQKVREAL